MTARQGKLLTMGVAILMGVAVAFNVGVTVVKHQPLRQLTSMVPGLLLIAVFGMYWSRYARLEAEHGTDHPVAGPTRGTRTTLIVVADQ